MLKVNGNKIQANRQSFVQNKGTTRQQNCTSQHANLAFKGAGSEASKQSWFALRKLSLKMKDASEITNAFIAAIGTGIIAPLIILVSPGKGDKEDNDKKFFQAIRQPLSAVLALAFQLPATKLVNKGINYLAYDKKAQIFKDRDLIPDNKYLRKQVTKDEIKALEDKFEDIIDGKSLKSELEAEIRKEYDEAGMNLTDKRLQKEIAEKKEKFLLDKIVNEKRNKFLDENVAAYKKDKFDLNQIKDADLVTEDDRLLAKHRNKAAFARLEKEANLSIFDKAARLIGLSTKKVKELEDKVKKLSTEKALKILKKDNAELFNDPEKKLRKFVENRSNDAKKLLANKKFWLSLFVNLFMVTASCYALNWAHPRFKELIDKFKHNDNDNQQQAEAKKVEVNA